ncbi:MAG: hypothetical protein KatS3mg114_0482 [Planctomycetaceae bacterium]|nr:MAG: hypothetical protein KatS3mg114_0482 [Planctomycetaceae bacterium]
MRRYVDLVRYVAWLVQLRHAPKPEAGWRPLREAQGASPRSQRGTRHRRSRHRRAAGGRQPGPQGAGGVRLSILLRVVLPADVPPDRGHPTI